MIIDSSSHAMPYVQDVTDCIPIGPYSQEPHDTYSEVKEELCIYFTGRR